MRSLYMATLRVVMYISLLLFASMIVAHAAEPETKKPIPRAVYALYDQSNDVPRFSVIHRVLEMPLNWLGFHMEYIKKDDPLPAWRDDIAGMILWMSADAHVPDAHAYLDWLEDGISKDKKLLFFGNFGVDPTFTDKQDGRDRLNKVLAHIGLKLQDVWYSQTYSTSIMSKDINMVEYERRYGGVLPSYHVTNILADATSHLRVKHINNDGLSVISDLITTHPQGGYVAENYALYHETDTIDEQGDKVASQRWLINPFTLINTIFNYNNFPKPDVSTLNGRRIFYSHLDGDGWNNLTEINEYAPQKMLASEVLLHEIFVPYQELPFTVAPIVSDLREDCYGSNKAMQTAVKIFALANIEPASHTYSHPLLWRYFDDFLPEYEVPFLEDYPDKPSRNRSLYEALRNGIYNTNNTQSWDVILRNMTDDEKTQGSDPRFNKYTSEYFTKYYKTPRSFACEPFDLTLEIKGSIEYMQELAPENKQVRLLQWSGNTVPAESALAEVSKYDYLNINGGDSRYDPEFPSYSYVAPIGIKVGNERQIYSSNSNENTYTDEWTDKYFGFRHLATTAHNTETPRRVSPFNIYYHAYSAAKKPSLEALKQNINYALSQDIIPIFASDYVRIANGYYNTKIIPMGTSKWRIANRGALQTMRFDHATLQTLDWERSEGVIGHDHYQGSLYVFLNPANDAPIIATKPLLTLGSPIPANRPYVINSNWHIQTMDYTNNQITMTVQGFGQGILRFYWPHADKIHISASRGSSILFEQSQYVSESGELQVMPNETAITPINLTLTNK